MKEITLPKVKYQQYRNTFLQNVIISLDYDGTTVSSEVMNAQFKDYLKSFFGIDFDGILSDGSCLISRKDKSYSFLFSKTKVVIQISGNNYECFSNTVIPHIFKLKKFFNKVIDVNTCTKVSIRKINIWNIKKKDKSVATIDEIQNILFSKNLLSELSAHELTEEEQNIRDLKKFCFISNGHNMLIRTALLPPTASDKFYHQILDTQIESRKNIKFDDLVDILMDMNSLLYYCFHWCVTDYVINLMNQDTK